MLNVKQMGNVRAPRKREAKAYWSTSMLADVARVKLKTYFFKLVSLTLGSSYHTDI